MQLGTVGRTSAWTVSQGPQQGRPCPPSSTVRHAQCTWHTQAHLWRKPLGARTRSICTRRCGFSHVSVKTEFCKVPSTWNLEACPYGTIVCMLSTACRGVKRVIPLNLLDGCSPRGQSRPCDPGVPSTHDCFLCHEKGGGILALIPNPLCLSESPGELTKSPETQSPPPTCWTTIARAWPRKIRLIRNALPRGLECIWADGKQQS